MQKTPTDEEDKLTHFKEWKKAREEQKALYRPPHFWACAPDAFIPNSVIRRIIKMKPVPPHMIPRIVRVIKPRKERKKKLKQTEEEEEESDDDFYWGDDFPFESAKKSKFLPQFVHLTYFP